MTIKDFQMKLEKYAEIAIQVGLNLQPGQRLLIRGPMVYGVPFSAAPLIREVTKAAYKAGARQVDVMYGDEQTELVRFQYGPKDAITDFSAWKAIAPYENAKDGNAAMTITGLDPDLLSRQDPDLVSKYSQVCWEKLDPFLKIAGKNDINWLVLGAPTPGWCRKVFPNLPADEAEERMWEMLFKLCRIDRPDPVQAWKDHISTLMACSKYLNQKQYHSLHYQGPGTDFKIGLPAGHEWHAAQSECSMGFPFTANIPTEEVYTLPHCREAEGVVSASLPLNYNGVLIDKFQIRFEGGRAINSTAHSGDEVLKKLIETDAGSSRLGEVAMVPHSSPIAQSGILFYNTLYDENAASHFALGQAYNTTLTNGTSMNDEEFAAAGGNNSIIHVDFMVGCKEMDIDGITENGDVEPVMRKGEWAFQP